VIELDIDLAVTPNFIADNFVVSGGNAGLGTGDYTGFAICNGLNGTKDRGGKTSVGYKPASAYQVLGASAGEEKHILSANETPKATIHVRTSQADNGEVSGQLFIMANTQETAGRDIQVATAAAAHNNMPPYVVTLTLQRIA